MILTGGSISRTFPPQNCFSFVFETYFSNWSGNCNLMFNQVNSVSRACLNFSSGAILAPFIFAPVPPRVGSWNASEKIKVSGDICSGDISIYFNENRIPALTRSFGIGTTGAISGFLLSGSPQSEIDFDIKIYGSKTPSYDIRFIDTGYLTGQTITGYVVNTSPDSFLNFKIFSLSGSFENNNSYYVRQSSLTGSTINPGSSGLFNIDYDNSLQPEFYTNSTGLQNLRGNIFLNSNFGINLKPVSIPLVKSPNYLVSFDALYTGFDESNIVWSYGLNRTACSGLNYEIILQPIRWFDSMPFSGLVSGYTGLYQGDLQIPGSGGSLTRVSANLISGRGFIPSSGCSDPDLFSSMRLNLTYNVDNKFNLNLISYIVRSLGLSEPSVNFTGVLEAGAL